MVIGYSTYDKALEIAQNAHASQVDKAGLQYILHPLAIVAMVPDDLKPVTLLYDAI